MGKNEKIIIIDDSDSVRRSLRSFLTSQGHRIVGEAASVDEACNLVDQGGFRVAIVDRSFPAIRGSITTDRGAGAIVANRIRRRNQAEGETTTIISYSMEHAAFGDFHVDKAASPLDLDTIIKKL